MAITLYNNGYSSGNNTSLPATPPSGYTSLINYYYNRSSSGKYWAAGNLSYKITATSPTLMRVYLRLSGWLKNTGDAAYQTAVYTGSSSEYIWGYTVTCSLYINGGYTIINGRSDNYFYWGNNGNSTQTGYGGSLYLRGDTRKWWVQEFYCDVPVLASDTSISLVKTVLDGNSVSYWSNYAANGYQMTIPRAATLPAPAGNYVKVDGIWQPMAPYINVNGVWKPASDLQINVSGTWRH